MSRASGSPAQSYNSRRRLWLASLGYAVAVVVWVLLEGPLSEPLLASIAHGALVVAVLLAAVVSAHWRFLWAAIPPLVLVVAWSDGVLPLAIFVAFIAAPIVFGVLAAGVAVGRAAQRRDLSAGALAFGMGGCIVVALGAGGLDAIRPPIDKHPNSPLTVDWRKGTYEAIALRDSTRRLVAKLGRPNERGVDQPAEPIGEDYFDIGGPTSFGSPGRSPTKDEALRFRQRAYFVTDGRISGWVTTSHRAETREGLGIGDSRDLVEQRYPQADCHTANEGTEYSTFPLCTIRVCRGRLLAFGGDPIKSIWLLAETNRGWGPCLKPTETRHPPADL